MPNNQATTCHDYTTSSGDPQAQKHEGCIESCSGEDLILATETHTEHMLSTASGAITYYSTKLDKIEVVYTLSALQAGDQTKSC